MATCMICGSAHRSEYDAQRHVQDKHQIHRDACGYAVLGGQPEIHTQQRLAQHLAHLRLLGVRVDATAAALRKRAERAGRTMSSPRPTAADKLNAILSREIAARALPTTIEEERGTQYLASTDCRNGLRVMHVDGYRYYSRREGSHDAQISYLLGRNEDGSRFVARIPGNILTVAAALAALEPAEVRRAREAGKRVVRQGDHYYVESRRDALRSADGHVADLATRTINHPQHGSTVIDFPARVVEQNRFGLRGRD